jgi:hypothetical protein
VSTREDFASSPNCPSCILQALFRRHALNAGYLLILLLEWPWLRLAKRAIKDGAAGHSRSASA